MGLFSGLKKEDVTDDNWMDQLLNEVTLAPEEPTGLVATMSEAEAEGWNFPDLSDDPAAPTADTPAPASPPIEQEPLSFDSGVLAGVVEGQGPVAAFDRRSTEPVSPSARAPYPSTGPTGSRSESMLPSFGLSTGATWAELQAAYLDIRANCDPSMATGPAEADQLVAILRDANSRYGALRLTAIS